MEEREGSKLSSERGKEGVSEDPVRSHDRRQMVQFGKGKNVQHRGRTKRFRPKDGHTGLLRNAHELAIMWAKSWKGGGGAMGKKGINLEKDLAGTRNLKDKNR